MKDEERRAITRGIAGFPMTDAECDVAEAVAARVLEKTFSTELSMKCVHPLCEQDSCGAVINDRDVCKDHIDWAMSRAFAPMREAFDKVFGTDAPVEHKIEKRCPHDEQICRHECEGDDCWRELDGS